MNESRPPLYLATGLLLGLALGVLISAVFFPARAADGAPAQLSASDKRIYRSLAAQAYAVGSNLERASARIRLLGDADPRKELAADAQRMLAEGKPLAEAEVLARLASALNAAQEAGNAPRETASAPEVPLFTPDANELAAQTETLSPPESGTPAPAATQAPTPTPAPTLGAPFQLAEKLVVCEADKEPGLIEVQVEDHGGSPVPGVRVDITWQDGAEFFFTGLIPTINGGYADYVMTPGVEYALRVGEGGEQVRGLSIPECTGEQGDQYPGSLFLRFTQP